MEHKAMPCELKFAGEDGTRSFKGYGAVFGNVDSHGDVIEPGAFAKTLAAHKESGTRPPMLLDHGFSAMGEVIGLWEALYEDGAGLVAEGRFIDTRAGNDAYTAAKAGALTGLSIGYRATEFTLRSRPDDPKRRLKAVDLVELSVVAVPANPKARLAGVKSLIGEIGTIREFEDFLRDAGGFSHAEAKRIASHGFKAFDARRDAGDGLSEAAVLGAAERLLAKLKG